jgi:hypothetical protein
LLLSAGAARGDDPYLLIDRSLRATPVSVASLGPGGLKYTDEKGVARELSLDEVVALAPEWWRPGTEASELAWGARALPAQRRGGPQGMLILTDGRRLAGQLGADAGAGGGVDRVAWEHPRLGPSSFVLDEVRRAQLQALPPGADRAGAGREANDRVVMMNGDAVAGFVESVGASIKVEADGKPVELNTKQVALVQLANPAKAPTGVRVWLEDGSVLGASALAAPSASGEFRVLRQGPSENPGQLGIPAAQVWGVVTDARALVPLASLEIAAQTGVGERRYVDPVALRWRGESLAAGWRESAGAGDRLPPLDAPDIELPGPMRVEWVLPRGASRVAGWAEVPAEARMWAECTLVIEGVSATGAVALASEALSGARPVAEFNIELPRPAPERLRVQVSPGARGPIQDRVVLRRALVLVEASGQ